MGTITVRNLDDAVIDALRKRAAAAGRSMEEEVRRALATSAGMDRDALIARMEDFAAKHGTRKGPRVEEIVREMRDERTEHSATLVHNAAPRARKKK